MTTFHNAPAENNDASPIEKQPAVKAQLADLRETVNDPMEDARLLAESLVRKLKATKKIEAGNEFEDKQKRIAVAAIEGRLNIAKSIA